jgi:transcriptional regulator with GAF, ATPase, and Fis domain
MRKEGTALSTDDWKKNKVLRYRIDGLEDLALAMLANLKDLRRKQGASDQDEVNDFNFYEAVQQFEIELISDALIRTRGHQSKAANLLGLKLTTLNSMIKRYKILYDARELRTQIKSATSEQPSVTVLS